MDEGKTFLCLNDNGYFHSGGIPIKKVSAPFTKSGSQYYHDRQVFSFAKLQTPELKSQMGMESHHSAAGEDTPTGLALHAFATTGSAAKWSAI